MPAPIDTMASTAAFFKMFWKLPMPMNLWLSSVKNTNIATMPYTVPGIFFPSFLIPVTLPDALL